MSRSPPRSRISTLPPSQPEVDSMSEAGPSRIQYPPAAVLASRSRGIDDNNDARGLISSSSSSSLFWRGPLQAVASGSNSNERGDTGKGALGPSRRRPSRVETDDDITTESNRQPSAIPASKRKSIERTRSISTVASVASSNSIEGGWVNWLSGRTKRASERAEAGKRLGKKLKRAEERARRKKQMAGRDLDPLDNGHDSDSDIVVATEDSIIRPPLDVPPPNETTANALSRVATKGGAKAPKLHFAPEEQKIRRKYLPQDYEVGELYRGLDEYVQASRDRRRRAKRGEKRRGSRASSRSSISKSSAGSGGSSSSSSDSDNSNSSSGSSSSSASGRLTMARLRAFFGDSSSSGSSSSSSSSSSSTTSKGDGSETDSSHSAASKGTFGLFRRRRASRTSLDSDADSITPATPRTPARHFQIKGGAERRRKRKAVQRYRAQEKRLIEEGKIPPKPSRKARKLAKLAREQAGGITEYTLFTPIALTCTGGDRKHRHHISRPSLGSHAFTAQRVDLNEKKAIKEASTERVLHTESFASIKDRLHALRRYRRQIENAVGDVGVTEADIRAGRDNTHQDAEEREKENIAEIDDFDAEDGDLALPPPALDLPEETASITSTRKMRRSQQIKDWHMSDVPLTPHVQMASDFARGFEVNSSSRKPEFHPTLATQREDGQTPPSDAPSSSWTNVEKTASGGTSTTAANPTSAEAHAAWWLDISCPTYRDMSELSKMFPLHPLTVEDILQQDTREKVEVFEKLNYYFVVMRAIDEKYFKFTPATSNHPSDATMVESESKDSMKEAKGGYEEKDAGIEMTEIRKKAGRVQIVERPGQQEGLEGVSVGAINIYLIVFSHGVISFHFEDISNHTDRIRSRLLDLTQPVELTSDWIAHGMIDSIVDAFFPLLNFLQTEIEEIETLTDEPFPKTRREALMMQKKRTIGMEQRAAKAGSLPSWVTHEKEERDVLRLMPLVALSSMAVQVLPSSLVTRRTHLVKRIVKDPASAPRKSLAQRIFGFKRFGAKAIAFHSNSATDQKTMLRRITDTRKIVTGLSRLLAPKNDSVRGLRKRLVDLRAPSISTTEMSIYMGDVHDHIVTMLSHLSSNDYRLNDIHSTYLSTIRMANNLSSHSKDEILIILATVTVTIVFTVFITSMFSFNIGIPMNKHYSNKHNWFGGVVFFAGLIPFCTIFGTYTLVQQAKKKTAARRAGR